MVAVKKQFPIPSCAASPTIDRSAGHRSIEWKFGKQTREQMRIPFISRNHSQDILGRISPGPVYEEFQDPCISYKFGTSPARVRLSDSPVYPPSFNDLNFKLLPPVETYKAHDGRTKILRCDRYKMSNAPDCEQFPPGMHSPGPTQYTPVGFFREQRPPKYTMRPKTMLMTSSIQTPVNIGPGKYPVEGSCGKQLQSLRKTLPSWSFSKIDRFNLP